MNTIGVVGAGRMGSGIAQVMAQAGYDVILFDISNETLQNALENIKRHLQRALELGTIKKEQLQGILTKIHPTTKLKHFISADIVFEAVIEDIEVKRKIFHELDDRCNPTTILATNTSSLSVTKIASVTENPYRVIGTHFFNPPYVLKLVEVVKAQHTSDDTVEKTVSFLKSIGHSPIVVKDSPGFIVNRISRHFYLEPLRAYEIGLAGIEEIDSAFKLFGLEMGPFEVIDYVGVDVNYIVSRSIYERFNFEERFRPVAFQTKLVEAGLLGRKTNSGFYYYVGKEKKLQDFFKREKINYKFSKKFLNLADTICKKILSQKDNLNDSQKIVVALTVSMIINEAYYALMENLALEDDINLAFRLVKFPAGPFELAEQIGLKNVFNFLNLAREELLSERYKPALLLAKKLS
ncbi:3-hydroxyacyl-CoA dehydrogenase [Candidatus Chrysopegis kryptomonas]|uniref:3-hydroxybutyryl-CoA dehydrogenase n=1 Tax=Candidatus Chryseopegocella kryptomonas TaxID=1633643 RepID=A0A0P1MS84_9BACT|nr:3-hydroxyacyl-CoA dehydrogenase [Candidatus Chrysopegis kryptomonas]CUS98254.1 3-hydroxybutyryl-CoA dehydrogenase [Candidatus Chrysopegis kryptomonas]